MLSYPLPHQRGLYLSIWGACLYSVSQSLILIAHLADLLCPQPAQSACVTQAAWSAASLCVLYLPWPYASASLLTQPLLFLLSRWPTTLRTPARVPSASAVRF